MDSSGDSQNPGADDSISAGCRTALAAVSFEYKKAHGYFIIGVCILGIFANLANIIVLTRKKMRSAVNALLIALAAAELALMCVYLPVGAFYYLASDRSYPTLSFFWDNRASLYYALFYSTFSMMCHAVAVWETIAVASFRFVRLRFPMRGRQWCSARNAHVATCVVVGAVALLSAPNWLINGIAPVGSVNLTGYPYCVPPHSPDAAPVGELFTISQSDFAQSHPAAVRANYWLQAVFVRLLPTATLALLTVLLVGMMRSSERRRRLLVNRGEKDEMRRAVEHNRTTGMLLAAVALVLSVEVPHGALIILMLADEARYRTTYEALGDFIDMATLLSQSLNFFLYTAVSTQFRHTFFSLFCRKWAERAEHEWTTLTTARRRSAARASLRSAAASSRRPSARRPSADGSSRHASGAGRPETPDGSAPLLASPERPEAAADGPKSARSSSAVNGSVISKLDVPQRQNSPCRSQ